MKKLIITICLFSLLFQVTLAQDTAAGKTNYSPGKKSHRDFFKEKNQAYYEGKYKRKETAAWVLLGGGAVIGTVGYFVMKNNLPGSSSNFFGDSFSALGGFIATVAGGFMVTGSVPLFISAHHYKKKAMIASASVKLQNAPELVPRGVAYVPLPSLSLTIHF